MCEFFFFFSPLSNHLSAKNQIKQSDLADGFVIKLSFSAGFNTNRSKLDFQMCLCTRFLSGLRDSSVRDGMAASRHTRMPTEEHGVDLEWRSHQRLMSEVVKETVGLVSWMRGGEALVAEKGRTSRAVLPIYTKSQVERDETGSRSRSFLNM